MRPMFSYMGSKYNLAKKYGPPRCEVVIEPFAGSAAYSLYWEPKRVILMDINPVICGIWRYLISANQSDILNLPEDFTHVDELDICPSAKHLIGFWLGKGKTSPGLSRSAWGRQYKDSGDCKVWGTPVKQRIAAQLPKIRSWKVIEGSYETAPDLHAHWFIDPPYSVCGWRYKFNKVDFDALAEFSKSRKGFVQVCENEGAAWLPFEKFAHARAQTVNRFARTSKEVIYEQGIGEMI